MCSADPGVAFSTASGALNEVTRLEEVRFDATAESWEELLTGLGMVISSSARLADCLGDHLSRATEQAGWRAGGGPAGEYPDRLLTETADAVQRISHQLGETSRAIADARDKVALLHLTSSGRRAVHGPAVGEPPA